MRSPARDKAAGRSDLTSPSSWSFTSQAVDFSDHASEYSPMIPSMMPMFDSQISIAQANGYSRPMLTRSRSHTDPSVSVPEEEQSAAAHATINQPTSLRPTHVRSRSHLVPSSHEHSKTRSLLTAPVATAASAIEKSAEKLPRLHLPGSSHRHHQHSRSHSHSHSHGPVDGNTHLYPTDRTSKNDPYKRGHRSTQSEAHPRKPPKDSTKSSGGLPNLVAGLNAERDIHKHQAQHQHQSRDAFGPSDTSAADYTSGGRYDPFPNGSGTGRHRAFSDPNDPNFSPSLSRQPSTVSMLLSRGDAARFAKRLHIKKSELEAKDQEIAVAEEELRSRIGEITSAGVEITRRLDYGYYNLLDKVNNLISTITSFQSLSRQTAVMIHNFDKETHRVDVDARRRIDAFKEGFEAKGEKGRALAERGEKVGKRAEQLEARLENARIILENWERREARGRERWKSMCEVFWRTFILLLVMILLGLGAREWWWGAGSSSPNTSIVGAAGRRGDVPGSNSWNASATTTSLTVATQPTPEKLLSDTKQRLPDDVKRIIDDIANRGRNRNHTLELIDALGHSGRSDSDSDGKVKVKVKPKAKAKVKGLTFDADDDDANAAASEDPRLARLDEL